MRSTVSGSITLGNGSTVQETTVRGITVNGDGTVTSNQVTSDIYVGSGAVLSNTVSGGGIAGGSGSTIQGNNVESAPAVGIQTSGTVTVTANRVVESGGAGMVVSTGLVQGNLIANSAGDGLQVGAATVISNTLIGNQGRTLYTNGGVPLEISGNNFEFNLGTYDLYNDNPSGQDVIARDNWWGTTDNATIAGRVFDFYDDYTKGTVNYTPLLTAPSPDAPAYVRQVTVLPDTTLGIQTGTFEVEFSRPMNARQSVGAKFFPPKKGTWAIYDSSNSGLPGSYILAIAIDSDDSI